MRMPEAYYYDRQGNVLTADQWLALFRDDADYYKQKRVAETTVGQLWVSTVWLGLNHQYGSGPPLIFETMIFPRWDYGELYMDRYSTEAEALAGHERAVAWAKAKHHGLTKMARDEKRRKMKEFARLLNAKELDEMEEMSLRLLKMQAGRRG